MPSGSEVSTSGGDYQGPLFDTHMHVGQGQAGSFPDARGWCDYLGRGGVLWNVVFYVPPPLGQAAIALRTFADTGPQLVPLLQPWAPSGPVAGLLQSGGFTEALLRGYLRPTGTFAGVGEIPMYFDDVRGLAFDGPQLTAVFNVVNEMGGIVMIHPDEDGRTFSTLAARVGPAIASHPEALFLFHGSFGVFDALEPLLDRYPNVMYTLDTATLLWAQPQRGEAAAWEPQNLMYPEGGGPAGGGGAASFLGNIDRIGVERILAVNLERVVPRLRRHPDRIMWGTDRTTNDWHYQDGPTEALIRISRALIGRLPSELQLPYAYQNGLRVFGRYLQAAESAAIDADVSYGEVEASRK